MKGKNFSCNNTKGLRKKSDFYETPYTITQHILDVVHIPEGASVLEPACGDGAIVRVLKENGLKVTYKDIKDGNDFLKCKDKYDWIITNPPFSLAFEFIQHSKSVCDDFLMLLPLSYLHGKARYDKVYSDTNYPLRKVYVFTRYPMLGDNLREDGKYRTGMMVYAWYHFQKGWEGSTEVDWIDNNCDVLSKKDL